MYKYKLVFWFLILISVVHTVSAHNKMVKKNIENAAAQITNMLNSIGNSSKNPRTTGKDGHLVLVDSPDWTSGFFPGCLWYMYEFTHEDKWKTAAQLFTHNVEKEQFNGTNHDIGFKIYCSYGNGLRLTGNVRYKEILLQSAKTLCTRFNPKVGCIRSWNHSRELFKYPVIIDNMMNLELLFWATKISGDSTYYKVAVSHANVTLKNHFRKDYSTYHVINYDSTTGKVLNKVTVQGYADESCWARGEAWALYGFTMCYRETKKHEYLEQAEKVAKYILTNKNLPTDMVPYWDYNAPNIPNEERDASAAAVMASAFYELSTFAAENCLSYKAAADKILESLSSPNYTAKSGENNNFLLMHSTGTRPNQYEVDVPLIYADYYFLEANMRKLRIEEKY
jgi:unsaturated chondroitin disaccharide hydrolase